jgi:hypothetical protein
MYDGTQINPEVDMTSLREAFHWHHGKEDGKRSSAVGDSLNACAHRSQ